MNLKEILETVKKTAKNRTLLEKTELDWTNYEFGKNFYLSIKRDDEQTEVETDFIINKLRLKKGSNILDLGCGGGRNAFALAQEGFKVTGVDINKYAIEQAIAQNEKPDEVDFVNQNILDIDYKECFDSSILIFNHFSAFDIMNARKLLKKIETALVQEGKVMIEIQSLSSGEALDGFQEWHIVDQWVSGSFEQLVLVDNFVDKNQNIHYRTDYCVNVNNYDLSIYTQKSYLYNIETLYDLFKATNLKIKQIYGDWEGKIFEDDDESMIIIAQK